MITFTFGILTIRTSMFLRPLSPRQVDGFTIVKLSEGSSSPKPHFPGILLTVLTPPIRPRKPLANCHRMALSASNWSLVMEKPSSVTCTENFTEGLKRTRKQYCRYWPAGTPHKQYLNYHRVRHERHWYGKDWPMESYKDLVLYRFFGTTIITALWYNAFIELLWLQCLLRLWYPPIAG